MPLQAILEALRASIETVPGIGPVYDYERIALEPTTLNGILGPLPQVHYWCLSRAATQETWQGSTSTQRLHQVRVRGYLGMDDPHASERTFQDILDGVLDTLTAVVEVPGSAEYISAPTLARQEPRRLADTVNVHFAEVTLLASEYLPVNVQAVPLPDITTYRALTDWLVGAMGAVPNLGPVYPYERLAVEPPLTPEVFGGAQTIRAWTVTRESRPQERLPGGEGRGQDRLVVRGFLSVNDSQASERVLQDLLEQVAAQLRPFPSVGTFDQVGPFQIEEVAHTRLGQTHLCHLAQCVWPATAYTLALSA